MRYLVVAAMALGALSVGACDTTELFHDCPLSESIVQACEADSSTTALTCVVTDHPLCEEMICAAWQNSDPFCTQACSVNADCPEGSTCETYLDIAFCVPVEIVNPPTTQQ
ncbi:MAG: hypothetical protein EP329_14360 [Deltaproteobacteria bacterium]|nr:MAG: hypothetical protein EP329_14360 [Deltaproteobacteria bacterium]